jgi:hypothetical protein
MIYKSQSHGDVEIENMDTKYHLPGAIRKLRKLRVQAQQGTGPAFTQGAELAEMEEVAIRKGVSV